jgi:heme-degrading monooxygenase HmoA
MADVADAQESASAAAAEALITNDMIMRVWRAYAPPANAEAYQQMIATEVLPGYHRFAGYRGTHILRREANGEVEFVIITMWESWEAVEEFAGPGHKKAVIWPKAAALLTRYDDESIHYEGTWVP